MNAADITQALNEANPVRDPNAEVDVHVRELTRQAILATPASPRPRRTARRFPRIAVGTVTAVAALTAASLLSPGDQESRGLPGAAYALAAQLVEPGAVLHTIDDGAGIPRTRQPIEGSGSTRVTDVTRVETWAALDGSVRRTHTTYSDGSVEDLRLERRDGRYRVTVYWSEKNELYVAPWLNERAVPDQAGPQLSVETIERYADVVNSGRARLDGETNVNGTPAYRITETADGPMNGAVWFISRDAEHPTLLRIQWPWCTKPHTCPSTTFSTYETTDTRSQLQLPAYPAARIVHGS